MKRKTQRGQIVIYVAIAIVVLFSFLALVLDFSRMYHMRQKLRNHADASALAGAIDLNAAATAKLAATTYYAKNVALDDGAAILTGTNGDTSIYSIGLDKVYVTTPYTDPKVEAAGIPPEMAIEVRTCRTVKHYIGGLLGVPSVLVCARAVAVKGSCSSVKGDVIPIGYPYPQPPNYDLDTPYVSPFDWVVGQEYNLSLPVAVPDNNLNGNAYFVALNGTGGDQLRDNFKFGASGTWKVGQIIQTEPGLMVGPVSQGVDFRVGQCPNATWDNFDPKTCPRRVIVLIVDPFVDDYTGRADVKIIGFACFFLERYEPGGGGGGGGDEDHGDGGEDHGDGGGDEDHGGGGGDDEHAWWPFAAPTPRFAGGSPAGAVSFALHRPTATGGHIALVDDEGGEGGPPGSVIGTFLSFCDINNCATDPNALFLNVGDIRLLE